MGVAIEDLKEVGRGCVADTKEGPQGQQSEVRGPQTAPSRFVDELLLQKLDGWKGIELFWSHSMIPPLRCSGDDTNSKCRAHDPPVLLRHASGYTVDSSRSCSCIEKNHW